MRLYVDRKYRYHFLAILGYDPPENQCLETVGGGRRDKDEEASDGEGVCVCVCVRVHVCMCVYVCVCVRAL